MLRALDMSSDEAAPPRDPVSDLVGMMALAARSIDGDFRHTIAALLDALLSSLGLAFALARLNDPQRGLVELMRVGASPGEATGDGLTFASAALGRYGELGLFVVASGNATFPRPSERLVLDVAATQATLALRTQAEDALRNSERQYRLLVDTIPALVWRGTADGDLDFLNQRAVEYLGHTAESLSKGRWLDVIHPDHRDATVRRWMQSVASGTSYDDIYQLRRADGQFRWTRSIGEPLRDAHGRIIQWYGVIVDVEERKRTEAELRRSEAFLAQAQRLTLTGSIWWDVATGDVIWSDETFRVMEVPRTTQPSVDLVLSRVHPEDLPVVREHLARAANDGANVEFAHRLLMPEGSVKHVHVVLQNIGRQPGKLEFVGAVTDVTARKEAELENARAEEALNRARAELAHVARLATLNTLTASIAHEVNQPLTGIITNASTCLRMLDADPPYLDGVRQTATRVLRDGNRAADVIARLRALFTRKEFTLESLDLNAATVRTATRRAP
jgi:PAS domain S-box-containing protein